jgi:hypothetical protein
VFWTLVVDPTTPTTLFAGTNGAVYKSIDSGESWMRNTTGLPQESSVTILAINPITPTILYAGTSSGVYISSNGGVSWSAINAGLSVPYISTLAVNPIEPTIVYAGTQGGGLFVRQIRHVQVFLPVITR